MRARRIVSLGFAAALSLGALVATSGAASAAGTCADGYFCAWSGSNYTGTKLISSRAPAGTDDIDVADDQVSSVQNRTGNRWCGVNNGFPGDDTVLSVAPRTNIGTLASSANNRIDHFYVRSGSQNCS